MKKNSRKKRTCRVCGCTEKNACITSAGPCSWVQADLCSNPECILKDRIIIAIQAKARAKEELRLAMMAAYPVGSTVQWQRHYKGAVYWQRGTVLTAGTYLRVENDRTGKKVSVGFYDLHGCIS